MFIPLHDANSLKYIKLQYVTFGLIAANVIIYMMTLFVSDSAAQAVVFGFGYVPAVVNNVAQLPPELVFLPQGFSYITYAFLHGDLFHLGGNMLFLWVFGDNVEDALGHFRYFLFYMICAAAGAFLHGMMAPGSQAPLIGASGAVAGIVAAYLILHPRVKVWVLALGRIPLRIPAFIPLLLWVGFQFVMLGLAAEDQISWAAHVGGMVVGAVLIVIFRRPGVPLFDRQIVTPDAVVMEKPGQTGRAAPATRARWGRG